MTNYGYILHVSPITFLRYTAQSPSPPLSPSFGDSASVLAAARRDDSDGSPVSLLFKDQQQFYQNMLVGNNYVNEVKEGATSRSISILSVSNLWKECVQCMFRGCMLILANTHSSSFKFQYYVQLYPRKLSIVCI